MEWTGELDGNCAAGRAGRSILRVRAKPGYFEPLRDLRSTALHGLQRVVRRHVAALCGGIDGATCPTVATFRAVRQVGPVSGPQRGRVGGRWYFHRSLGRPMA